MNQTSVIKSNFKQLIKWAEQLQLYNNLSFYLNFTTYG